tara:strand:- start:1848 stop:2873 length:1026 start_codon:yes stop_codon:yes gene_type:complete
MSITVDNLSKLVDKCNFYIKSYYGIHKKCTYIEVVSKDYGVSYLMYIPSKYKIYLDGVKHYELKQIKDVMNSKDVTYEYGYNNENRKFDEMYSMTNITDEIDENVLQNNYKRELNYVNVRSKHNEEVKSIYRQISRFKFSVESLKYKLGIMFKSYMCVITRSNDIVYYYIKNYKNNLENKRLVIMFDLETLYEIFHDIHKELKDIRSSIYVLLNKNYNINLQYIQKMITEKVNIEGMERKIDTFKKRYDDKYNNYNNLLTSCIVKESLIRDKIKKDGKNKDNILQLKDILKTKSGIIMDLINLIDKRDNYILLCDNVMYDNVIMYDKICNNIKLINEFKYL